MHTCAYFGDKVSLCGTEWPQTQYPSTSVPGVYGCHPVPRAWSDREGYRGMKDGGWTLDSIDLCKAMFYRKHVTTLYPSAANSEVCSLTSSEANTVAMFTKTEHKNISKHCQPKAQK